MKGRRFGSREDIIQNATVQLQYLLNDVFQQLPTGEGTLGEVVQSYGVYFDGDCSFRLQVSNLILGSQGGIIIEHPYTVYRAIFLHLKK